MDNKITRISSKICQVFICRDSKQCLYTWYIHSKHPLSIDIYIYIHIGRKSHRRNVNIDGPQSS